jgi:putative transcriptional regulator
MKIEDVAQAVEADAGEPLPGLREALTDVRAGRFARVQTPMQILVKSARAKTGMTQADFANRIHTPLTTLRDWEQGRFDPPGGVACLLALIARRPEITEELLTI